MKFSLKTYLLLGCVLVLPIISIAMQLQIQYLRVANAGLRREIELLPQSQLGPIHLPEEEQYLRNNQLLELNTTVAENYRGIQEQQQLEPIGTDQLKVNFSHLKGPFLGAVDMTQRQGTWSFEIGEGPSAFLHVAIMETEPGNFEPYSLYSKDSPPRTLHHTLVELKKGTFELEAAFSNSNRLVALNGKKIFTTDDVKRTAFDDYWKGKQYQLNAGIIETTTQPC